MTEHQFIELQIPMAIEEGRREVIVGMVVEDWLVGIRQDWLEIRNIQIR